MESRDLQLQEQRCLSSADFFFYNLSFPRNSDKIKKLIGFGVSLPMNWAIVSRQACHNTSKKKPTAVDTQGERLASHIACSRSCEQRLRSVTAPEKVDLDPLFVTTDEEKQKKKQRRMKSAEERQKKKREKDKSGQIYRLYLLGSSGVAFCWMYRTPRANDTKYPSDGWPEIIRERNSPRKSRRKKQGSCRRGPNGAQILCAGGRRQTSAYIWSNGREA